MPKAITVKIEPPKCFSEHEKNNKSCENCIFLFDCIEKKSEKETRTYDALYKYEFPDYDGEFYVPDGWEDNSWHNDVCPHAELRIEDEKICFLLWQDYVDVDKRECGGHRYSFIIEIDNDVVFCYTTDDINEALKLCKSVWR